MSLQTLNASMLGTIRVYFIYVLSIICSHIILIIIKTCMDLWHLKFNTTKLVATDSWHLLALQKV